MDWIPLLSAVGVGAIVAAVVTKVLDVLWLQRVLEESERRKWLRAEKLRAYAALSRDLMDLRGWSNWRAVRDAATGAMLLEEDAKIRERIDAHLTDIRDTSEKTKAKAKARADELSKIAGVRTAKEGEPNWYGLVPVEKELALKEALQEEFREERQQSTSLERQRLLSDARTIVDMMRLSLMKR